MVIGSATDVGMLDGCLGSGLIRQRFLIQVVFEDRLYASVAGGADGDSSATSGIQSPVPIAFGQP